MQEIKQRIIQEIKNKKSLISVPEIVLPDLVETYKICRVLDESLALFFDEKEDYNNYSYINAEIDEILNIFKTEVLTALQNKKVQFRSIDRSQPFKFRNIFEYAGSENLYLSSIYTRFISENLGHKLEDIANISQQVFIPEKELNLSLKGIDLIIYDQGLIKYAQLKTKKDTLTGSQRSRSVDELKIHPHSMFVAALDMGKSWNPSPKIAKANQIELLAGEDFWSLIGLDYTVILNKLSKVINEIDKELYQ
ncbi:hypothetical protein PN462_15395 [Spirulina sp. CS-785/01]|uniref:hypothetical protein n=1 Tax=Spirulina sp. CS-785/01 TaxID=3021716 RepID=UPI00232DAE9F|nr:hypothetical protein [Spirulina sp. CS-785/01]MDB9314496.1 hypothetical protein [Spirulina sp. CS-785/01]